MQSFDPNDGIFLNQTGKPSISSGLTGFSHGAFTSNYYNAAGVRDRLGGSMQNLNSARNIPSSPNVAEMQTPGTAYDMNFTPLLPSQLLMGSPFQPGSPSTFASPQFQPFSGYVPQNNYALRQLQPAQNSSPLQSQQALATPIYQDMISQNQLGGAQYLGGPQVTGNGYIGYVNGPAMSMAPGLATGTSRTVYLGNIPPETSAEEILGHVRSGQIESVRLLSDKNCAFISFLDSSSAVHFHSDAILKKLAIGGKEIKVGWGKPSQVPSSVALAVQQSGASRNVYLGNLPAEITSEELREDLGKFGPIDTIKLVREKSIGFVHFLSIGSAIKAVSQLPQGEKWQAPRRVFYGKDRCAYISKTQQQNAAQYVGISAGYSHVYNSSDRDVISTAVAQQSVTAAAVATAAGGASNMGNRTVYLGNIHPETSTEEICNVVRGGLLHHIRFIPEKHICFVTFIDPSSAASFFASTSLHGLMIHNRRLRIGWGKHSGPLPPAIALAVQAGASRNVYIGNIDESWTEERLRQDFSEYGETELINTLREKSCAFANFTNIANAIKAIEAVRGKEEYKRFKINFGKDRCGNPPRQVVANPTDQNQHLPFQMMQEPMISPPINGTFQLNRGNHPGNSSSPVGSSGQRLMPTNSGRNSNAQMQQSLFNGASSNPMTVYLNQIQNQQQQQQQSYAQFMPSYGQTQQGPHQQNSFAPSNDSYVGGGSGTSSTTQFGRHGSLEVPYHQQQPQFIVHGSSNSFNAPASSAFATVGGLLAPTNLGAAARAQHSRAISLPVFPQGPSGLPQQHQLKNLGNGNMGTGLGLGAGSGLNGFGLAIQGDLSLSRWAEEDVIS